MARRLHLPFVLLCLAAATPVWPQAAGRPQASDLAPQTVDFVFDNGVRQTRDLPTASLRAIRRAMLRGEKIGPSGLRALADAGDGLAAFRYAKLLQEQGMADPTGVIAHYYAIAAYTGRGFAVPPLAQLLREDGAGYGAARLRNALNAMTVQALSGNAEAATLLGQMYSRGAPFGMDATKAQTFLAMGSGSESMAALLQLGVILLADAGDTAAGNPAARAALQRAATGDDLSVRVTAENLLRLLDNPPHPESEAHE